MQTNHVITTVLANIT